MRTRLAAVGAGLAGVAALGGCISTPPAADPGIPVGDATLAQFKAGETTEAWMFAVLGEPSASAPVAGVPGVVVHRYHASERVGGPILHMVAGTPAARRSTAYFVVENGVIARFWADRADPGESAQVNVRVLADLLGKDEKKGDEETRDGEGGGEAR